MKRNTPKRGFDDAFLFGRGEVTSPSQNARDERTANFDIQLIPTDWLAVDAGIGRSEEKEPQRDTPLIRGDKGGVGGRNRGITDDKRNDSQ